MTFISTQIGAAAVFRLNGSFGAGTDFSALHHALGRDYGVPVRTVFFDMAHVTQLDCVGIGELIRFRQRAHAAGRAFGLVNLNVRHRKLLDMARLSALLGVRQIGDGAVTNAAFRPSSRGIGHSIGRSLETIRRRGATRRTRLALA